MHFPASKGARAWPKEAPTRGGGNGGRDEEALYVAIPLNPALAFLAQLTEQNSIAQLDLD